MRRHMTAIALTLILQVSPTAVFSQSNESQSVSISSVTPASIIQSATDLRLTVRGSGFTSKSQIRVNGEHRQTAFVSSGELRTSFLPLDVAAPRTSKVAVFTPSAGTTRELVVTVTAPVVAPPPDIEPPKFTAVPADLIVPATSGQGATVTITLPQATDNSGKVTVTSNPAAGSPILLPIGTTSVSYTAVDPTGNKATATSTINVKAPAPTMSISGLEPASAIPGAASVATLAVRGAGFTNGMVIRWNGIDRATTFNVSSVITTFVRSADVATVGTANVTVYNPATGAETPAAVFYIDASKSAVPRIIALGRNTAVAGTAFGTAITGERFIFGSVVRVNGVALPANQISYNGAAIIGMQLTPSMIAIPGAYRITVFNPGPNGGESNAMTLTVNAQ